MFEVFSLAKVKAKVVKKDSKATRFVSGRVDITEKLTVNQSYLKKILKEEFFINNFNPDLPSFYIDLGLDIDLNTSSKTKKILALSAWLA